MGQLIIRRKYVLKYYLADRTKQYYPCYIVIVGTKLNAMNNYVNNNPNFNSMSCYGSDYDENLAYQQINISSEEVRMLEELSQGFANSFYPFK